MAILVINQQSKLKLSCPCSAGRIFFIKLNCEYLTDNARFKRVLLHVDDDVGVEVN